MNDFLDVLVRDRSVQCAQHVAADLFLIEDAIVDAQVKRGFFFFVLVENMMPLIPP